MIQNKLLVFGLAGLLVTTVVAVGGALYRSQNGGKIPVSIEIPAIKDSIPSLNQEMINGIPVPPEPDPVINNATLAGVDSNNNGVRDDVERMIGARSSSFDQFTNMLTTARAYQVMLVADSLSQSAYDALSLEITCAGLRALDAGTLDTLSSTQIKPATFNTDLRKAAIKEKIVGLSGRITNARKECR